jgi:predicted transposase YbfD/YdcC
MLWALADPQINAYVGSAGTVGEAWPHVQQVCRVERRRTVRRDGQEDTSTEVLYAVTSLPPSRADAQALLRVTREHWGIENKVHWVRDVTFDEDRHQVRKGAAPQVFAAITNLVCTLLRRQGCTNIAAALRTNAGRPRSAVALILTSGP